MALIPLISYHGRTTLEKLRHIRKRAQSRGIHQGWICAKTYWMNAWVHIRNNFCRHPQVECPCCAWRGYAFRWVDFGPFTQPEVECPQCMAHERHRMMHIFLQRRPPAFLKKNILLHFAPEEHLACFYRKNKHILGIATDFVHKTVILAEKPRVQADIQALPFPDKSIDGIFCLHVLEHIRDDRQGIRELARVLKPEGEAVIMVPFMPNQHETIEYSAPDPDMFGHLRGYAMADFTERFTPFDYEEILPSSFMSEEERQRYRIPCDDHIIYVCRKKHGNGYER